MKKVNFFLTTKYTLPRLKLLTKEDLENKVCQTGGFQTLPIELNTVLVLREIIKINEEENSITIQMTLATFWTDLSLAASNTTKL